MCILERKADSNDVVRSLRHLDTGLISIDMKKWAEEKRLGEKSNIRLLIIY